MEVIDSNRITEGKKTALFEKRFSDYIGVKETVLVNSGTSALITALSAIKYFKNKPEEKPKIITTPLTYIATSNAVVLTNQIPVFIDVDPNTFTINPDKIEEHLENIDDVSEYSTILPVHLMGYPAEMKKINKIAEKYGLNVIEDASQAHGTVYEGKTCGSMSDMSTYSFYIAHNIQVGEMGALCTSNDDYAKFAKRFKANGRMCDCKVCTRPSGVCQKEDIKSELFDPRFYHIHLGYNFKTTDIFAAIGIEQLKNSEQIKRKRYENIQYLNEELSFMEDMIKLPKLSEDVSYLAYPLVIKDPIKMSRAKLSQMLEKKGIESRPLFGCIPLHQPAYTEYKKKYVDKLPVSEYLGLNGLYIGCHQYLDQQDLEYIVKEFKEIYNSINII